MSVWCYDNFGETTWTPRSVLREAVKEQEEPQEPTAGAVVEAVMAAVAPFEEARKLVMAAIDALIPRPIRWRPPWSS